MTSPNANPAGTGGVGGDAVDFRNDSISRPRTHSTLTAELLRLYGDFALHLIRLSGPKDQKESPGKRPLERAWQRTLLRRKSKGVTPAKSAAAIARHLLKGENIGLAVPEHLVCLDADTPEAVQWLDQFFPDAPRQKTGGGGLHVMLRLTAGALGPGERLSNRCQAEVAPGVKIDVRAHGTQIAVEPSVHASGGRYKWLTPLPAHLDDIPEVSTEILLKLPRTQEATGTQSGQAELEHRVPASTGTQSLQSTQSTHSAHSIPHADINANFEKAKVEQPKPKAKVVLHDDDRAGIEAAIAATLPKVSGQRNYLIFQLASRLKAVGPLADLPAHHDVLHGIVVEWHKRALAVIGTKDFDTSWMDFLNAWPKANPHGMRFRECVQRAVENPDPFALNVAKVLRIRHPKFVHLLALACELDRLHEGSQWPLGGRIAADALGVDPKTTASWLQMLMRNKVLVLAKEAIRQTRRAAEYRLNRGWATEP